jgi:Spy/CpxP family protein refolding chaperone
MQRRHRDLARVIVAAICFAAIAMTSSLAQGRGGGGPGGGPPPGGGPGGGGMMGGGPMPGNHPPGNMGPPPMNPGNQSAGGQMRPGLQFGPPGQKWWDDKSFAKTLKLRPEQQTRMDVIFEQNKNVLLSRLQGLQQAESQMEEISRSPTLDEAALFTQIDRVAQARADLEKANTHMLLQIRKEMDPDQIARLEKHHE